MSNRLRIDFGLPRNGWIGMKIGIDEKIFEMALSNTPQDSIGNLAAALSLIMKGGAGASAWLNGEPTSWDFYFGNEGGNTVLTITQFRDGRKSTEGGKELLCMHAARLEICLPFWRALRRLNSLISHQEFALNWGHAFPEAKVKEITTLVEREKANETFSRHA